MTQEITATWMMGSISEKTYKALIWTVVIMAGLTMFTGQYGISMIFSIIGIIVGILWMKKQIGGIE
jgi:hypothetical protein